MGMWSALYYIYIYLNGDVVCIILDIYTWMGMWSALYSIYIPEEGRGLHYIIYIYTWMGMWSALFRYIYMKRDAVRIILDIYTWSGIFLHRVHRMIFLFEIFFIAHTKCLCQIMFEDTAGLDYKTRLLNVQRKLFPVLNVRRAFKSHELLVKQELKVFFGRLPVL